MFTGYDFDTMNLEKDKQVAEMYYSYREKTIAYIINAPYKDNSLGIDFEDSVKKGIHKKKLMIVKLKLQYIK